MTPTKERTLECPDSGKIEVVPFLITAAFNGHRVNRIFPHYIKHEDKNTLQCVFQREASSGGVIDMEVQL